MILVPTNAQANGKYCVIVWSKSAKRTVFKINFSKRVKSCLLSNKQLIVVLRNQINIYELTNFGLEFKKDDLKDVLQAKIITIKSKSFLVYLEENSGKLNRQDQPHRTEQRRQVSRVQYQTSRKRMFIIRGHS